MSVKNENAAAGESVALDRPVAGGVYASLFEKINLNPVSTLSALDIWQDAQAIFRRKPMRCVCSPVKRWPLTAWMEK
ncbi:hypothetical protein GCM10007905_33190 [Mixta theicola]|nr:hypothetical protein GCM10007905_33190 [Mixta theicola]